MLKNNLAEAAIHANALLPKGVNFYGSHSHQDDYGSRENLLGIMLDQVDAGAFQNAEIIGWRSPSSDTHGIINTCIEPLTIVNDQSFGSATMFPIIDFNEIEYDLVSENAHFSPSVSLTKFWINGIKFIRETASLDNTELDGLSKLDEEAIRKLFADRLFAEIVGHFQNHRKVGANTQVHILNNGSSSPWLELMLSNLFEVQPKEMGDFVSTIDAELLDFFNSTRFGGDWGTVGVVGDSVVARLIPAIPVPRRDRNSQEIDV